MMFTVRPFRFLYLSAVAAVAWYNFGWLAAGLVFLATIDAVPKDQTQDDLARGRRLFTEALNRERMGNLW